VRSLGLEGGASVFLVWKSTAARPLEV